MRILLAVAAGFVLGWMLRPEPEPAPPSPVRVVRVEGEDASLRARLADQEALVALLRREIAEQDQRRSRVEKQLAEEARLAVPERQKESRKLSVAGTWESNCGPVTLRHDPVRDGRPVSIMGSWVQEEKYHGKITGGSFNPATGEVRFTWYQDWDRQEGETVLKMSADGRNLDGSYTSDRGSGRWTLAREGAEWKISCFE